MAVEQAAHLQATSRTNLLGLSDTFRISTRIGRTLHLLAKLANFHGFPATNSLHTLEELRCRLSSIHVGSNIGIVNSALLKDAHAVIIRAHGIIVILEGCRDLLVGVNKDIRLEIVSVVF